MPRLLAALIAFLDERRAASWARASNLTACGWHAAVARAWCSGEPSQDT